MTNNTERDTFEKWFYSIWACSVTGNIGKAAWGAWQARAQASGVSVQAATNRSNGRCPARVIPKKDPLPGPHNPPIWCHLPKGHAGPHRHNGGIVWSNFLGKIDHAPFGSLNWRIKPEPVGPREVFLNIYPNGDITCHLKHLHAIQRATSDCVAIVRYVRADEDQS